MKIAVFSLFLLCIFIGVACKVNQNKFVPFYPTYENDNDQYYSEKEYSEEMKKGILQVLDYYDVKYEIEKNDILIEEKEYKNKELMCNYTKKSIDQNWLKEHKK